MVKLAVLLRMASSSEKIGSNELLQELDALSKSFQPSNPNHCTSSMNTEDSNYSKYVDTSTEEESSKDVHVSSEVLNKTVDQHAISELGKGLGPIVQTRDGGYLISMNICSEKEEKGATKLVMQVSKPSIIIDMNLNSGFQVFKKLAAMEPHELYSKIASLPAMDELQGKTAELVAFEGVASAIVKGKSTATTKAVAKAMVSERVSNKVMAMEEVLPSSMRMVEAMAWEGVKIQAEMSELTASKEEKGEEYDGERRDIFDHCVLLEDWERGGHRVVKNTVNVMMKVQPRDAKRAYEAVGCVQIAIVDAVKAESNREDEEEKIEMVGIHIGGLSLKSVQGEKEKLSTVRWMKNGRRDVECKIKKNFIWSLSSNLKDGKLINLRRNPNIEIM